MGKNIPEIITLCDPLLIHLGMLLLAGREECSMSEEIILAVHR